MRFRKPRKRRNFHAERAVIAVFFFRQPRNEIGADFFARERRESIPRHAEFFHRFFERTHRAARKIGIGGNVDGKEILIHVLFKTRKHVRAREFAVFERFADETAPEFFQFRHRLFVHAPVCKHIEVVDQRACLRIEIIGYVLARDLVFVGIYGGKKTLFRRFKRVRRL